MQRADPDLAPRAGEPRARRQIGPGAHRGDALILGAVIAGGRSTRFGSDKAVAIWAGRPLIDHAIAALGAHVDAVVVCGREWPGVPSLPDWPAAGLGPLGGIAAALVHAGREGHERVLTVGCDMPEVPAELLRALLRSAPSYCADAPILGSYPAGAEGSLCTLLACATALPVRAEPVEAWPTLDPGAALRQVQGERRERKNPSLSIRRWAESIGARAIPSPAPLRNVNIPADLA